MKDLVEPIKLTEPAKPVKNQSLSVNQQKPQQQGEEASGQKDFQAILDKQVQERRTQDKKQVANKQQNKVSEKSPKESKQAKTEATIKASPKEAVSTEPELVEEGVAEAPSAHTELKTAQHKHATAKQPITNEKINVKGDPKPSTKVEDASNLVKQDVKPDTKLSEQATPKHAELNKQSPQPKGAKLSSKLHRHQVEKATSLKQDAEKVVENEDVAIKALAPQPVTAKPLKKAVDGEAQLAEEQSPEQVDVKAQTKIAQPHTAQLAHVPVDNRATKVSTEEQIPVRHALDQAPGAEKMIKSAEKQLLKTTDQTQVKSAVPVTDEAADDIQLLAEAGVKDVAEAKRTPKHSAIAELQKAALAKRHQAKQLQKDMSAGQLRSAMAKEGLSERGGLATEAIPRSDRATDFIQTMHIQAATVKPAAQRPVQAESFKADELKAAVNKAAETPVPVASTQTTIGVNAAFQSSNVMAAAPMGSSNQIYAYPGKSGWNQAISQKVMYMVGASEQTARLSLNPPELGPLQVVIEVNDEKANTTFISDNEDVRQALEDGMDYLREKMDEAGISLGEANVNDGQRFNQPNQQEGFASGSKRSGGNQVASEAVPEEAVVSTKVQSSNNGLVDTFA